MQKDSRRDNNMDGEDDEKSHVRKSMALRIYAGARSIGELAVMAYYAHRTAWAVSVDCFPLGKYDQNAPSFLERQRDHGRALLTTIGVRNPGSPPQGDWGMFGAYGMGASCVEQLGQ